MDSMRKWKIVYVSKKLSHDMATPSPVAPGIGRRVSQRALNQLTKLTVDDFHARNVRRLDVTALRVYDSLRDRRS